MLASLPLADWLRPSDWLPELPGPSESLTRESLWLSDWLDRDSDSLPSETLGAESPDGTSIEVETLLDPLGVSMDWDDSDSSELDCEEPLEPSMLVLEPLESLEPDFDDSLDELLEPPSEAEMLLDESLDEPLEERLESLLDPLLDEL